MFYFRNVGLYTVTAHMDILKLRGHPPWHFQKRVIATEKLAYKHTKKVISSDLFRVRIWVTPMDVSPIKRIGIIHE